MHPTPNDFGSLQPRLTICIGMSLIKMGMDLFGSEGWCARVVVNSWITCDHSSRHKEMRSLNLATSVGMEPLKPFGKSAKLNATCLALLPSLRKQSFQLFWWCRSKYPGFVCAKKCRQTCSIVLWFWLNTAHSKSASRIDLFRRFQPHCCSNGNFDILGPKTLGTNRRFNRCLSALIWRHAFTQESRKAKELG